MGKGLALTILEDVALQPYIDALKQEDGPAGEEPPAAGTVQQGATATGAWARERRLRGLFSALPENVLRCCCVLLRRRPCVAGAYAGAAAAALRRRGCSCAGRRGGRRPCAHGDVWVAPPGLCGLIPSLLGAPPAAVARRAVAVAARGRMYRLWLAGVQRCKRTLQARLPHRHVARANLLAAGT